MNNLELWIIRSGLNRESLIFSRRDKDLLHFLESLKGKRLNQEKINKLVEKFLENKCLQCGCGIQAETKFCNSCWDER